MSRELPEDAASWKEEPRNELRGQILGRLSDWREGGKGGCHCVRNRVGDVIGVIGYASGGFRENPAINYEAKYNG